MNKQDVLNPIVAESAVTWLPLNTRSSSPAGHTTVVYLSADQENTALTGRPPGIRELLRRSYWRYDVDTALHWTALTLGLPAEEEAFAFKVWVSLTWKVHDPVAVVQAGITDLRPTVWGFLDQQLRGISRRFGIEQAGLAEEEMTDFLERKIGDIDYGIRLGLVSVNVRLDEAAERYLVTRVESRRARSLAEDDHELETLRRQYAAELARRKGDLEREQVTHATQIERMRAEQDRELAALTDRHELALKRQRVEFYQSALTGGGYDVLVLHLIEHPQDAQTVIKMLHEGRMDEYDRARAVIQNLIDKDLMNAADAEPMREHAIDRLRSAFDMPARTATVTQERTSKRTEEQTETTRVEVPIT
jgi:hypothetical protein